MRKKLPLVKSALKLLGKCGLSALVINSKMVTIPACAFRTGWSMRKLLVALIQIGPRTSS